MANRKFKNYLARNLQHHVSLVIVVKTGKSHNIDRRYKNLSHPLSRKSQALETK